MAVDWMGNVPSADLGSLLAINQASSFAQFRAALTDWHAPTQNFVYADSGGAGGLVGAVPSRPGCRGRVVAAGVPFGAVGVACPRTRRSLSR
jgi:acyl-homoserine lactone acylase PvdQ